jgi:hypothetical protein
VTTVYTEFLCGIRISHRDVWSLFNVDCRSVEARRRGEVSPGPDTIITIIHPFIWWHWTTIFRVEFPPVLYQATTDFI